MVETELGTFETRIWQKKRLSALQAIAERPRNHQATAKSPANRSVTFVIHGKGKLLQVPRIASHPKLWEKIPSTDSGAATAVSCKTLSAESRIKATNQPFKV